MTPQPWPIPFTLLVDHCHDGDTIMGTVQCDAGLRMAITLAGWSIRFYGINAPELRTPEGQAAAVALQGLVKPGDVLSVESYSFDNYGHRIDGIPYLADGTDLCQWMLDNNWAVKYPS